MSVGGVLGGRTVTGPCHRIFVPHRIPEDGMSDFDLCSRISSFVSLVLILDDLNDHLQVFKMS